LVILPPNQAISLLGIEPFLFKPIFFIFMGLPLLACGSLRVATLRGSLAFGPAASGGSAR
jgi:hypothetical protein